MKLKDYIEKLQDILELEGNLDLYCLEEFLNSDYYTEYLETSLVEGINNPEIFYVDKDNTYDYSKDPSSVYNPIKVLVL